MSHLNFLQSWSIFSNIWIFTPKMTTFSIDFQTLCYEIISEQFRFLTYFKNVAYFANVTLHIWDSLRNVLNFFSFFFVSYLHAWAKFYDAAAAARLCPRPSFGVSRHALTFDERSSRVQSEHNSSVLRKDLI